MTTKHSKRNQAMNNISKGIFATCISMMATQQCLAKDVTGYIGVGGGISNISASEVIDGVNYSIDANDAAFKAYGGFKFKENFGLEISYSSWGNPSDTMTVLGVPVDVDVDITMFNGYIVGYAPVSNDVQFFGKVGFSAWDTDTTATAGGLSASVSGDGTDFAYGLGISGDISKQFSIRAEWEGVNFEDVDGNTFMVGAQVNF